MPKAYAGKLSSITSHNNCIQSRLVHYSSVSPPTKKPALNPVNAGQYTPIQTPLAR